MAKYHIDLAGNPGVCRATKRCPYGDLERDHFTSPELARKSYEIENTPHRLELTYEIKEVFNNVGPRQLPNRAWVTLRRALEDNQFSQHDLGIALTAIDEERVKLTQLTQKPIYEWGDEEQAASNDLGRVSRIASLLSGQAISWENDRRAQMAHEESK